MKPIKLAAVAGGIVALVVAAVAVAVVQPFDPDRGKPARVAWFEGYVHCAEGSYTCVVALSWWWGPTEDWSPRSPQKEIQVAPGAYYALNLTWAWRGAECGVLHVLAETHSDDQDRRWKGCAGETFKEGIWIQP